MDVSAEKSRPVRSQAFSRQRGYGDGSLPRGLFSEGAVGFQEIRCVFDEQSSFKNPEKPIYITLNLETVIRFIQFKREF